jgi:hypothetical protein
VNKGMMMLYKRIALKIADVYHNNKSIQNKVNKSPEFYRALVWETGIILNPEQFDCGLNPEYDKLINELEELFC